MSETEKGKLKFASLNPEDMSQGILDDVDVTIRAPKFLMYDYEGKATDGPTPCFGFIPEVEGMVGERMQYYGVGNAENWAPSPDGFRLVPIGAASRLSVKSGFGQFMHSLVETAGFPKEKIANDIRFLDGVTLHMAQLPVGKKMDGSVRTSLLPVKLVEAAAGGKGKAGRASAKVESVGEPQPAGGGDDAEIYDAELESVIMGAVLSKGTIAKKDLVNILYKGDETKDWSPEKKKMAFQRATGDEWLKNQERPWTYANGKLSQG